MVDEKEVKSEEEVKSVRLAKAEVQGMDLRIGGGITVTNPWGPEDVDKMGVTDLNNYRRVVGDCRFFYQKDPLATTVINRIVDIAINGLRFSKHGLSIPKNEMKVYESIKDELLAFSEIMALEYLISGLVVPEIKMASVRTDKLRDRGIQRYATLTLPVELWLQDPGAMKINQSFTSTSPSYYIEISDELIFFIANKGEYPDGTEDKKAYRELVALYPEFVALVKSGEKYILLDNDSIVRGKYLSNSPYPIPYLYPIIEAMKHKRNLRRMDYAVAARVIGAIQLFRLGSDEFPVTEDDEEQFDTIRAQMTWRHSGGRDVESIFQLFANHTLQVDWIYPPFESLLDDTKYRSINQEILFGLGFPRILITGESEKSNASDAEYATMGPIRMLKTLRRKIIWVIRKVIDTIVKENGFKNAPRVEFGQIDLYAFNDLSGAMTELYETGNLSRESLSALYGYDWHDEIEKRADEQEILKKLDVPEFSPKPHSQNPELGTGQGEQTEDGDNIDKK